MSEIISFIQNHWDELLAIIGGVVSIASIIILITPNKIDDKYFYCVINFLSKFSIFNTKIDKKILEQAKEFDNKNKDN